ncbi:MAG: BREX-4 system phosphatase PglZ, partial [Prevotella sp.]|nr:BREX-4 system phosphatase PglZ [Prevotella sp.]
VIRGMQNYSDIISSFCKEVYGKGKESLYYMTDLNKAEKEMTIELLSLYGSTYDKEELISTLRNTYPDLALYLSPFDSGNKELDEYMDEYKYCKVMNKISDEFIEKLNYQATEHHIYELQSRSSIVENLIKDKNKTVLYFMDAMGIEFLGFLQNKCFENKLLFHAEIGRCDLPSITSFNNGFVDDFKQLGCMVYDKKELDKLKHEGLGSYNYENTKIPIHIVEELNILNELIKQLKTIDKDKTVYIISDHGATRLAVINECETKWDISEKGLHSGRCCPKGDISEKLTIAIEENDFWCLTNYDRFKGGRKASVEVHGGATIEEVAVPIITINKLVKTIGCKLVNNEPIKVSYKQKAEILLYVEVDNENISISVNGKIYAAKKTDIRYQYAVQMPDLEKEGVYTFNVYMEGSLICKDLTFEVIKAVKEKKYFN